LQKPIEKEIIIFEGKKNNELKKELKTTLNFHKRIMTFIATTKSQVLLL
jgi:hypothetical protein